MSILAVIISSQATEMSYNAIKLATLSTFFTCSLAVCVYIRFKHWENEVRRRSNTLKLIIPNRNNETIDLSCGCLLDRHCFKSESKYFHNYTTDEARQCFIKLKSQNQDRTPLILIGDSRLNRPFIELKNLLKPQKLGVIESHWYNNSYCDIMKVSSSVRFADENYKAEMYFMTPVNDNRLLSLIDAIKQDCENSSFIQKCPLFVFSDMHAHDSIHCHTDEKVKFLRYQTDMAKYIHKLSSLSSRLTRVVYKHTDYYFDFMESEYSMFFRTDQQVDEWMGYMKGLLKAFPSISFWDSQLPKVLEVKELCRRMPDERRTLDAGGDARLCMLITTKCKSC